MISFIKKLFGFGSTETASTAAPYKIEPTPAATYIEPAKPVIKTETVAASAAPAKKNRRPRNRNRVKPSDTVAKITEGKTKGGNGQVKTAQDTKAKTQAPKAPVLVKATKPANKSKQKSKQPR
jgi:hypothetical protein